MLRTTLLALAASAAAAVSSPAQTVDEVIARSLEARGGLARLQATLSVRMQARVTQGGHTTPLTIEMKRPGRFRADFKVDGTPAVMAWDGREAWGLSPVSHRPEPLPEAAARGMSERADLDGPLVDYAAKGHRLAIEGKSQVGEHYAYRIRVTKKSGDVEYHFIDERSWLPVRVESRQVGPRGPVMAASNLGDYREVAGFLWPYTIENEIGGVPEGQTIRIDKLEANVEIDDARFSMAARARD
jgi:outer membrane lipoprotein-sorting protein